MMNPSQERRTGRRNRKHLWRDVLEAEERSQRARVVPLPLALAAVMLPFLAAWAAAEVPSERVANEQRTAPVGHWRELPEALRELGRGDRVAGEPGSYVDVWGRTAPWEADAVRRRGYVRGGH